MREREREAKLKQAPKVAAKQYDTDTDGEKNNTDSDVSPLKAKDFNPANPMGLPDDSMPHGYNK